MNTARGGLPSRDTLSLLSNFRRREIIKVLSELGGEASLREVVRRVSEREKGAKSDRKSRKSVYTGIIQTHLPKLRTAGIVEYDRGADTMRIIDLPNDYRYYLEAIETGDIPWSLYYLAISVFGIIIGVFFAAWSGLMVSSIFILGFSLFLLFSAILHTAKTYGMNTMELLRWSIRIVRSSVSSSLSAREKRSRR